MSFALLCWPPLRRSQRDWPRRIGEALPGVRVLVPDGEGEAIAAIAGADALYAERRVPAEALAAAARLRWIHSALVAPPPGWFHDALIAHPAAVTNPRGIYNDHIGAHIAAFVLAFARRLHRYLPDMAAGKWERAGEAVHLPDATALIVGVGEIGAEAARLLAAFGMTIAGVDARRRTAPPGVAELHPPEALDRLLPRADFVILTVPHTPETEGLMHAGRLAAMKDTACLVNVGRGPTVRLGDLDAALRAGRIGGAALDVFEAEPLPPDHPLRTAPNVLLTPHVAAHGPHLDERRFGVLLGNCRRFAEGRPLRNPVDKARWY